MNLKRWALAVALYGSLSLVCFAAPHVEVAAQVVGSLGTWGWLLGPPAFLVDQTDGLAFYLAGTALIAAGIWVIGLSAYDSPEVGVVTALILAAVWSAFGALVYVLHV